MREALREYGPITALIVIAMVGYALYSFNRDDIFTYSLDLIGERMMEMVGDPEHRATIAGMFGQFKERAMANEISPEQVELMAANVLNLSHSRITLTPEQAELVLNTAYLEPDTALAALMEVDSLPALPMPLEPDQINHVRVRARPPRPPRPPEPADREALGKRLQSMIAFDAAVQKIATAEAVDKAALAEHMQYMSDEGLRVVLDAEMQKAMPPQVFERFNRALKKLDDEHMVIHQRDLARRVRTERMLLNRELQSLESLQGRTEAQAQAREALKQLEAFKHLQAMGYRPTFRVDSAHALIFSTDGVVFSDGDAEAEGDAVERLMDEVERKVETSVGRVEGRGESAVEEAEATARQEGVRVQSERQGGSGVKQENGAR